MTTVRPDRRPLRDRRGGWRSRARAPLSLKGEGPVEFAILAFPILVLTFMLVQAALVWYAHSVALGAATQGANAARLYGSSPTIGYLRANAFLNRVGPALTDTNVRPVQSGNSVTVTVTGKARSIIPGMTFNVTQSATGPIERFVP